AEAAMRWLDAGPIKSRNPRQLGPEAWRLADALGWAKTYDAEYLALAQLLGCRVVTLDGALQRGAARLDLVVGLHQL
ncbi:MAG: type II toxin-antitoxin system VapC family toxin, partial [Candidatus Limnocylindria bacterium]